MARTTFREPRDIWITVLGPQDPEKQLGPGTRATLAFKTFPPMFGALGDADEGWQADFPPDSSEVRVLPKSLRRELGNSSSEGIAKT